MSRMMFQIGEAAELVGITPKTIRHYQQMGLLEEPPRDSNNYRLYTPAHLERMQAILRLKEMGLSLSEIKAVLDAPNPDELVRALLQQHIQRIQRDINSLQNNLENIQSYLEAGIVLPQLHTSQPEHSAMRIVSAAVRQQSNGLADVLTAVEGDVLAKIDAYQWDAGYDAFWHQVASHLRDSVFKQDSLFIFWMERYLALKDMAEDDLQARAWLQELAQDPARGLLVRAFNPPLVPTFSQQEQQSMHKLLLSLMYQQANTLQKQFLNILRKIN